MSKNRNQNENGFVNYVMSNGLVFGTLVMLFTATMASVGVVAAAGANEGELLVSIKGEYPSLSHDFNTVVYSTEDEKYELWVMKSEGCDLKRLDERTEGRMMALRWSPDGEKILYVYGKTSLWVINSDGTGKRRIAEGVYLYGKLPGAGPIWSPDGEKIAYFGGYPESLGIYVINNDGSGNKKLQDINPREVYLLSWTPDSKKILLNNIEIDIKRGVIQKTQMPSDIHEVVVVSSDASKIAYRSNSVIKVGNIDGGKFKEIVDEGNFPQWSPDSKRIAFISERIIKGIWVTNSDGSDQKKIAELPPSLYWFGGGDRVVWNQEGSKIAYATYENKTIDLYTINVGKPSPVKPPAGETPLEKQQGVPGFEAVFAIGGLLAVAYLLRRVK